MSQYKRDVYDILGVVAMILTPTAAAVFFGWRVWSEVLTVTSSMALAGVAAVATAVSLEIVGIYAGHVAITFYRQGDRLRGTIAGIAMLAYVGIGVWELQGTIGAVVFLIAPLVYLLVALRHDARAVQTEQRETAQQAWEREQQAIADERQYKLERLKIRQGVTHDNDMTPVTVRHDTDHDRHSDNGMSFPGNWTELTPEHKAALKGMTPVEIERMAPVSYRTAIRWRDRVSANGSSSK